ncbi:arylsulfatase B [Aureliella helgolandensis]|uniref:Arylsulfatase n=1 Tax=Aureliella helgolandensis TaxID=2527968 RepID=A0A518FZU4_9BACT|nr:arylsulfatase [Aureliella helgolandensis]QDV21887.1 Arylsulfatase precursor [Aureliella helgolandensis]
MNRSLVLVLSFLYVSLDSVLESSMAQQLQPSRPNIVMILSDDMGYGQPGFTGGNPELTPNIDRLAAQGMQLTQFYTHSVCAPTRAAFLTGRYPFRTWSDWRSEDFGKPSYLKSLGLELPVNELGEKTRRIHALDTEERTVAEALQEVGYFTSIIGKWHCGEWLKENLPMQQGFDHQYGHYAWGIDYNTFLIEHNAPAPFHVYDWHRNEQPIQETGYTTDLIASEFERVLAQQSEERPFFIYVPFNAVHGPINTVPRHTDKYSASDAALKCYDEAVGRILASIDANGFAENTLVICTNDNGGLTEASNKPWRGTKNTTFEGGVHVPCIMRWPGMTVPGSHRDGMMHITDCFATFATLAGSTLEQPRPLDSFNMSEMLFAEAASPRTEIVYEVSGSVRVPTLRQGDFKLMGELLFNLVDDPAETTDVAAQHPELVQRMTARLQELGSQRPPLGDKPLLMTPALPYVYGEAEAKHPPQWLIEAVDQARALQPQEWPEGKTPWPQAPEGISIDYSK